MELLFVCCCLVNLFYFFLMELLFVCCCLVNLFYFFLMELLFVCCCLLNYLFEIYFISFLWNSYLYVAV